MWTTTPIEREGGGEEDLEHGPDEGGAHLAYPVGRSQLGVAQPDKIEIHLVAGEGGHKRGQAVITRSRLCEPGQPIGDGGLVRERHRSGESLRLPRDDFGDLRQLDGLLPRRKARAHRGKPISQVPGELADGRMAVLFVTFPPPRVGRRSVEAHQCP